LGGFGGAGLGTAATFSSGLGSRGGAGFGLGAGATAGFGLGAAATFFGVGGGETRIRRITVCVAPPESVATTSRV
jgi:hypothetical protein